MERPFIHINLAMDCAGRTAPPPGGAPSISCDTDWRRVHELREQYDAVAVGGVTWLTDRPRLNVRPERLGREPKRQPARVIFAGSRPCAVTPEERPTYVIGSNVCAGENILCARVQGWLLGRPLRWLYRHRVRSMLVEGGPTLLSSFLREGFVDRLTVFVRAARAEPALNAASTLFGVFAEPSARSFGEGILLEWKPRPEAAGTALARSAPPAKLPASDLREEGGKQYGSGVADEARAG